MKVTLFLPLFLLPFMTSLTSCKEKGPAESTGERIDNAAEKIKDAVDPKGPAEKAGEKLDNAIGN